jgi:LuxR family transcriptional regulator, maltose regulon positive regulatory protein
MAPELIADMIDIRPQAYPVAVDAHRLRGRDLDIRIGAVLEHDPGGKTTTDGIGQTTPFVMIRLSDLLARHPERRADHAALLADILDDLVGASSPAPAQESLAPEEELSESELRVLRYLPSHLSAPEIADALCVSTSTVKTHLRHIYAKLGVHRRAEAVECARARGLVGRFARSR